MKTLNKKLVKQISKMLLVLLAFNLVATTGIKASAVEASTITYDVKGELKKGNTVDITVNANNVSELYGASFDFAYDPTIMTVESATQGTIFGSDAVSIPVKNLKSGSVEYALMLNGANATAKAKTGSLVTLKVKLLKDATVTLKTSDSNAALSATGINCRVKLAKSGYQTSDIKYTAADKKIVIGEELPVPSKLISFTADKNSSQVVGTTINFTANATPVATSEYMYYVSDGKTWTNMQSYSSKNTFAWKPTKAGNYTVRVRAVNASLPGSASDSRDIKFTIINSNIQTPSKLTAFSSDKASGQSVGTTINFTANATPANTSNYIFYVSDGKTWTTVQNYSSKNTLAWKPTKAGNYTIRVRAINTALPGSASDSRDLKFTVTNATTQQPSKLTSFYADKSSNQVAGTTINFTANATPASTTNYIFYVSDGKTWTTVQNYSSKNTLAWKPTKAGNYTVRVRAINTALPGSASDSWDLAFVIK